MKPPAQNITADVAQNGPQNRWKVWAASAFLLLCWFCTVPVWSPDYPGNDLIDFPWRLALWEAHRQGLAFGSQVIFTYGPLGYLTTTAYLPDGSYELSLLFRIAICLWSAAAVCRLAVNSQAATPIKVAAILVLTVAPLQFYFYDPIAWLVPILLMAMEVVRVKNEHTADSLLRALGIVLLAALALGKFTLFMLAMPVVFALIGTRLVDDRKRLWEPALFFASLACFWLISGQSPGDFFPFIKGALNISAAHSQGNGYHYPSADIIGMLMLATSISVWAVWCYSQTNADKIKQSILFVSGCGVAFVCYKSGISRAGTATLMTASSLIMLLCLILITHPIEYKCKWKRWTIPGLSLVAVSLSFALYLLLAAAPSNAWLKQPLIYIGYRLAGLADTIINPDHQHEWFLKANQAINQALPLPEELRQHPSDMTDLGQHLLYAWSVPYRPKPTILDYTAQVSALIEANRAHFAGPRAPEQVFFSGDQIDRRYPLLNQSTSLLELIARYRPVIRLGPYTVLHKRQEPRVLTLVPLTEIPLKVGDPIDIPPVYTDGLLWAQLRYKTPLAGRLWDIFHRTPHFIVQTRLANGRTLNPKASATTMTSGFLLSPFVVDELKHLLWLPDKNNQLGPWQVRRITLEWESLKGVDSLFDAPMTLKLFRVELSDQPPQP